MNILNRLFSIFKRPKLVKVHLNPDSVQDNHQVKALAYENAQLKGEVGKLTNHIAKIKQRDSDKLEEENIKAVLNDQKNEIKLKSQGKVFSLSKFYRKLFQDKRFRQKLGIYSFDRSQKLANFGDFGITSDGDFALFDSDGNLIVRMESLKDIFQSVGGLPNDVSTGVIPINMDDEGSYIENIMDYNVPEIIQTGNKLKYAKARKRPVYEIIQQLNEVIGGLQSELQESEALNIELQNRIGSLKSEANVNREIAETSRAELSNVENRTIGIDRAFRTVNRDVISYQNLSSIQADNINKLERELARMREKAEREGTKLSDDKALELIQDIRATVVAELPDVVEKQNQKEETTN